MKIIRNFFLQNHDWFVFSVNKILSGALFVYTFVTQNIFCGKINTNFFKLLFSVLNKGTQNTEMLFI